MTVVKFCGMRRAEDIDAVNRLKPEYVGFNPIVRYGAKVIVPKYSGQWKFGDCRSIGDHDR